MMPLQMDYSPAHDNINRAFVVVKIDNKTQRVVNVKFLRREMAFSFIKENPPPITETWLLCGLCVQGKILDMVDVGAACGVSLGPTAEGHT